MRCGAAAPKPKFAQYFGTSVEHHALDVAFERKYTRVSWKYHYIKWKKNGTPEYVLVRKIIKRCQSGGRFFRLHHIPARILRTAAVLLYNCCIPGIIPYGILFVRIHGHTAWASDLFTWYLVVVVVNLRLICGWVKAEVLAIVKFLLYVYPILIVLDSSIHRAQLFLPSAWLYEY